MYITIELPAGIAYQGTRSWFIDSECQWSMSDLLEDIRYATRHDGLVFTGSPSMSSLAADVLSDGDVVVLEVL